MTGDHRQKLHLPRLSLRPDWPYVYTLMHVVVALSGPAFYAVATGFSSSQYMDANIGAGMAQVWTAVCGLPWSLIVWPPLSGTHEHVLEVLYTGCALLNVGIVTALLRYRWR